MKPIKLSIEISAYDCYLYGGYVFFIMRDGRILYGSYPRLISRLEQKYQLKSGMIKIAFLRNDYYHSNAAKAFLNVPEVRDAIYREWVNLVLNEQFILYYDEIEDILSTLCVLPSLPLDTRIYGMRLFVGCVDGLYEVRLCPEGHDLNPQKIERCFDGKVIHLNAKYGEIVLSLGMDGLVADKIDINGDEVTKVRDNNVFAQRSHRTSWASADIMNYSNPMEFSYFRNTITERSRSGQKNFWEKYETKQIVSFASQEFSMDRMIVKSGLIKDDIVAVFNSQGKSFFQLKDGSIVSCLLKEEKDDNVITPVLSNKKVSLAPADTLNGFGRMLSGTTIPKGCVIEFFDRVVLFHNSTIQTIENEEVMKVRSFMSSNRFQDILSVTKQNYITLHALDTLDVSRTFSSNFRNDFTPEPNVETDGIDPDWLASLVTPDDSDDSELPY